MSASYLRLDDVGIGGCPVWASSASSSNVSSEEHAFNFGLELSDSVGTLKSAGGVYFGVGYDPMSEDDAELTGMLFSICQCMGVPAVFRCVNMSWAEDYAGFAAMLGIRRELACFGSDFLHGDCTASLFQQRRNGIAALHKSGFKTWVRFDCSSELKFMQMREHLLSFKGIVDCIEFTAPVSVVEDLGSCVVASFLRELSDVAVLWGIPVILSDSARAVLTMCIADGEDFEVSRFSRYENHSFLFEGVDMTVVEAGDITSMVENVCRETSEENLKAQGDVLSAQARDAILMRLESEGASRSVRRKSNRRRKKK